MDARGAFGAAEQQLLAHYGLAARFRSVDLDELRLRVRVLEVGEGQPVLFVHGGGSQGASWIPLLAHLRGMRAIVVDRPGCGLSDPFLYQGVDLRRHGVSFMRSLLDALELERLPVVGNSMGGLWALWTAVDAPERIGPLALLGCPALILDTGAPLPMHLAATPLGEKIMLGEPSRDRFLRSMAMLGERGAPIPDAVIDAALAGQRIAGTAESFLSLIRACLTPFGRRLSFGEAELRRVRQPSLFVWGDHDPFGRVASGQRAAQIMPSAHVEVVRGGHLPWLDEPEHCAALVAAHLATHASVAA